MKKLITDLLKQNISREEIARRLNTTVWQVRKVKAELEHEKKDVPKKLLLDDIKVCDPRKVKKLKTYIFTSWEIRTDPSDEFLGILHQMEKHYNAEVFIIPVWPEDLKYIPPKLKEFNILSSDLKLNSNIFFKYVPTHALVVSPLTGWKGAFPDTSVIIPGLIKEMITEPSHRLAKQLMSTGSVGRLNPNITNYKHLENYDESEKRIFDKRWNSVVNRRAGRVYAVAQEYTLPSALVVNILDDKTFLSRYVTMEKTGVVYDMNLKFTYGESKPEISRPSALYKGDTHVYQMDEDVWEVTGKMIDFFDPDAVVVGDFMDFSSANWHGMDDASIFTKAPTIEEERDITRKRLVEICKRARKVFYDQSNHDNFIIKYLKNENNYKFNYNYAICLELRAAQLRDNRHPVVKLLDMDSIPNLEFVPEDSNHSISGVTNIHGHQTVSGRPAGFRSLAQIYNRVMMGHGHSPKIWRNAVMVGTGSKLQMDYNTGLDGWLHCNGLIHPDGSTQLLPIIGKRWKL